MLGLVLRPFVRPPHESSAPGIGHGVTARRARGRRKFALQRVALLFAPFIAACGSAGEAKDTGNDEKADTDSESMDPTTDLFLCDPSPNLPACETVYYHIDPEPLTAMRCNAWAIANRQPMILHGLRSFGPFVDETEWVVVLLGDGTAIVQRRDRACAATQVGDCPPDEVPWTLQPPQRCEIGSQSALETCFETCETGSDCACAYWHPFDEDFVNCTDAEDWTCASALEFVSPPVSGCEHDSVDDCCCFYEGSPESYSGLSSSCNTETLCSVDVTCDLNGDGVIDEAGEGEEAVGSSDPVACEVSALLPLGPADELENLSCALEALAEGRPGKVRYAIQNFADMGWSGHEHSIHIAEGRTAFVTEERYEDLDNDFESPLRVELESPEYFRACALQESFQDRFACLAAPYAAVTQACW